MLSLHTATEDARKVLIVVGVLFVLGILLYFSFPFFTSLFPTEIPKPTVTFGKLPRVVFLQSTVTKQLSYSVETISGSLPLYPERATPSAYPDRVTIYKTLTDPPNLLALQRAQEQVERGGFENAGTALSETVYQWQDDTPLQRTLSLDILSYDFTLTSNYLSNPTMQNSQRLLLEQDAIKTAQSFLANVGIPPSDLNDEAIETTLYSITDGTLVPATSLSTTQAIRVDFFQKAIDDIPLYYPNPPSSTMYMIIANTENNVQVVEANFKHQNIDIENTWATQTDVLNKRMPATYPLKTAQQAFDDLKNQKAYIASYTGTKDTVAIRAVKLGYYIGESNQGYLLPIVVFEGDDNFFAYVDALEENWLSQ